MYIMFAGIIVIFSLGVQESPRYLMKQGRVEQAAANTSTLHNLPVDHPIFKQSLKTSGTDQLEREQETTKGAIPVIGPLRELFTIRSNLYRIMLGSMSQLLGQWSDDNSISTHALEYFARLE